MKRQDGTDSIVEAINRQNIILENLPESIGRAVAKNILKADMPEFRNEMREDIHTELGFLPSEIVDRLYPNLGKSDRRAKAQSISLRRKR